jgi:DNA ligase-1
MELICRYLFEIDETEILPTIAFLKGNRPNKLCKLVDLKNWAIEKSRISEWLFDECLSISGDLSETISKILKEPIDSNSLSCLDVLKVMEIASKLNEIELKNFYFKFWDSLQADEKYVFNKLSISQFKLDIPDKILIHAIAKRFSEDEDFIAIKLSHEFPEYNKNPNEFFRNYSEKINFAKPFDFIQAGNFKPEFHQIKVGEWIVENLWLGLKVQLIKRDDEWFLWGEKEGLINQIFPELKELCELNKSSFTIEGIIQIQDENGRHQYSILNKRLNTKVNGNKLPKKNLAIIIAYDLLECDKVDLRSKSLLERRNMLAEMIAKFNNSKLSFSEEIGFKKTAELNHLRNESSLNGNAGIILKRKYSLYQKVNEQIDWLIWKLEPYSVLAVLLYAQPGSQKIGNIFSEFTFALKSHDGNLVPFVKIVSALTEAELNELNVWIKQNTKEKFGPVRSVKPELVFEIEFEDVAISSRTKSGMTVSSPKIVAWRKDKTSNEINVVEDLKSMIKSSI